jgi:muconolactone delta-isomerase
VEFLVEFEINIPNGTSASEVNDREIAEAAAAAELVHQGRLARVWNLPAAPGKTKAPRETKIAGLYRAENGD